MNERAGEYGTSAGQLAARRGGGVLCGGVLLGRWPPHAAADGLLGLRGDLRQCGVGNTRNSAQHNRRSAAWRATAGI